MDKVLSYLGLAKKAGRLKLGEFLSEKSLSEKKAILVIVAKDASERTKERFTNKCNYYNTKIIFYGTKEELGKATGGNIKAVVTVIDEGFSKAILSHLN